MMTEHGAGLRGVRAVSPWLILILITFAGYWLLLGFWPRWEAALMLPAGPGAWFPDMYAVLAASDLNAAGIDAYEENSLGVRHFYPRMWFGLATWGLTREHTHVLGLTLGGIFLGASWLWLRPRKWSEAGVGVACLLSPPMTLGFQRANVDFLLYIMTILLALVLTSRRPIVRIGLGGALVVLGTLLKFYPVFCAFASWWNERGRRRWWVVVLFVIMGALFAVPLGEDYLRISSIVNFGKMADRHVYSFGANFDPAVRMVAYAGFVACAGAAGLGWFWLSKRVEAEARTKEQAGFMIGACLLLGCFALGSNFVYRLVFVLLMMPWWWKLRYSSDRVVRVLALVSILGTILLLWWDAIATVGLRETERAGWGNMHIVITGWYRQALGLMQWLWCSIVVCLLIAMTRQIPVATESAADRK